MKQEALHELFTLIATGQATEAKRLFASSPELAVLQFVEVGRSKLPSPDFLPSISRQLYSGDTALHVASATYATGVMEVLIKAGADARAKNRRGSQPLHYAAVGNPGSNTWNPCAQSAAIELLIDAAVEVDAIDKSGVTPLHKAVRTRCAAAVRTLLARGASARGENGSGSTPLHLAVQNTGRGGSGTVEAKGQQLEIIRALLAHGAQKSDTDARGQIYISTLEA